MYGPVDAELKEGRMYEMYDAKADKSAWLLASTFVGNIPGEECDRNGLWYNEFVQTEDEPPAPAAKPEKVDRSAPKLLSGWSALGKAMKSSSPFAWMLELRSRHLTQQKIVYISRELLKAATESIVALNVSDNNLGQEGCDTLASILETNHSLTFLDLSHNSIPSAAGIDLLTGLRKNHSLVYLALQGNDLGTAGAIPILTGVRMNESSGVTALDLSANSIDEDATGCLVELMRDELTTVSLLAIGENPLVRTPRAMNRLCLDVIQQPSLRYTHVLFIE
jgi:hypothetical protein